MFTKNKKIATFIFSRDKIFLLNLIFIFYLLFYLHFNNYVKNNCVNLNSNIDQTTYDNVVQSLIKWRRQAGSYSCNINSDGVGPTGGWCLRPSSADWGNLGKSAEHHVVADDGIGKSILKFLNDDVQKISLIDIGAGVGQYGYWLKANNANIKWFGYDGAENVEEFTNGFVKWIDVTNPIFDSVDFVGDWVMSLECGEHIPPENTHDLINLLDKHNKKGILLSWGVPGQGGHSHINERSNENIIQLLLEKGYIQDEWCLDFQEYGRQHAQYSWFKGTFMVFKRKK